MLLLLLAACESGLSVGLTLDVADDVATAYTAEAPGLLRADADGYLLNVAPVCGDAFGGPIELNVDLGFGCVKERDSDEATLRAWIEPTPDGWDLGAFCALRPAEGLDLSAVGPTDALAETPDPSWPAGETTAPWKRDITPCGGRVEGEITVE